MITDPLELFDLWFAEARNSEPNDPEAMVVATVDSRGQPAARMCLLKGHGPDGFVFYTNLDSRKGADIAANPRVALLFHWKSLRRQVRVEGKTEPVRGSEADSYFATRSRESRLGAWASDQSRPLTSRKELEDRLAQATARFAGEDVPRPPRWGGFRVRPDRLEFWTDRPHRLHERRLFTRRDDESWDEGLLYP